jgi:hypothetical protein
VRQSGECLPLRVFNMVELAGCNNLKCMCACVPGPVMYRARHASGSAAAANADYLAQKLHYSVDGTKLLDADGACVLWVCVIWESWIADGLL